MKTRKPAPKTKAEREAAFKEWLRDRPPATAAHTRAEPEQLWEEALSKIDRDATIKEITAFREQYGMEP